MRSWVSKLLLIRISRSQEDTANKGSREIRIQTRRRELAITHGQLRGALQALVIQNANALALMNDVESELGAKTAKQLFLEVGFPPRTPPDKRMRNIEDQPLAHVGPLPHAALTAGDQSLKEIYLGVNSSIKRVSQVKRPINPDLLTVEQTCELFGGITKQGLYKGIGKKRFPRPIKIGPQTSRWLRSECEETLRRRAEERD